MVSETKEELLARIERLEAEKRDMQDQINRQAAAAQAGKHGWMISTPNPNYSGYTGPVYFENGHAFISAERTNALKLVAMLTQDFGYSATAVDNGEEVKAPVAKGQSIFEAAVTPQVMN